MKRRVTLVFCMILCLIFGSIPVYASSYTTSQSVDIPVTFSTESYFTVTLPESISGSDGLESVDFQYSVKGTILDGDKVTVNIEDNNSNVDGIQVELTDETGVTKEANISISKNEFLKDDIIETDTESGNLCMDNLSAGAWRGTARFIINLESTKHTHSYHEEITKEATCTEDGVKTYTCDCSDTYTEVIPSTGHADENGDGVCDKCGETLSQTFKYTRGMAPGLYNESGELIKTQDEMVSDGFISISETSSFGDNLLKVDINKTVDDRLSYFGDKYWVLGKGLTVAPTSCMGYSQCTGIYADELLIPTTYSLQGAFQRGNSYPKLKHVNLNFVNKNAEENRLIDTDKMFIYSTGLEDVTISGHFNSVGDNCFQDCAKLVSVELPEGCKEICTNAFSNSFDFNSKDTNSIVIPSTVTTIGDSAFSNTNLSSIELPSSLVTMGAYVFSSSKVSSIIIPDSVVSIGKQCFKFSYIKDIHLSSKLSEISESMFESCSRLTSVTIPASVKNIRTLAFKNCSNLENVIIEDAGKMGFIEDKAFYYCSSLKELTIPSSVYSIGSLAFKDVRHITYSGAASGSPWGAKSINGYVEGDFVYKDETKSTLNSYLGNDSIVTIPNGVSVINSEAFSSRTELKEVVIPEGVTKICSGAFISCTNLTSVTIPSSVSIIEKNAFAYCKCDILIPDNVSSIGTSAFYNVPHITYNGSASGSPWGATSIN